MFSLDFPLNNTSNVVSSLNEVIPFRLQLFVPVQFPISGLIRTALIDKRTPITIASFNMNVPVANRRLEA